MGAIKISSVGKIYPNGTRALGDVNIEINDGEFVVLVGPYLVFLGSCFFFINYRN